MLLQLIILLRYLLVWLGAVASRKALRSIKSYKISSVSCSLWRLLYWILQLRINIDIAVSVLFLFFTWLLLLFWKHLLKNTPRTKKTLSSPIYPSRYPSKSIDCNLQAYLGPVASLPFIRLTLHQKTRAIHMKLSSQFRIHAADFFAPSHRFNR